MTKEKFFTAMGWIGMITSVLMYIFYFPQIERITSQDTKVPSFSHLWQVSTAPCGLHTDYSRRSVIGHWLLPTHQASSLVS